MSFAAVCVLAWLGALSGYDIRRRRLPNWLTLPGAAAVLIAAAAVGCGGPALLGALALFAVYLTVHLVSPAAMGAGDVKLAIGVGGLTGAFGVEVWMLSSLGAALLSAAWAVVATVRHANATVPHGPSMCAAAAVSAALALG